MQEGEAEVKGRSRNREVPTCLVLIPATAPKLSQVQLWAPVTHSWMRTVLHPLELQKEIRSRSKKKTSSTFCCLPTSRAQDTKTAVTKRKNRLRDHVDLSLCQQVQDETGVPSSELQSFFHCPAPLSFHLLIQVLFPSRHKENRPNPDSECSEAPRVVGPVVLHACVYPACFVEGSPSCLTVNSRCSITKKGRQRLFFFFFPFLLHVCVHVCMHFECV